MSKTRRCSGPKLTKGLPYLGLDTRKPVFGILRTTKAQTSLPSLISAFVIRFLERTICKPAIGEISICLLVSVAEETGLKLALLETPKTGFLATRPILYSPLRTEEQALLFIWSLADQALLFIRSLAD